MRWWTRKIGHRPSLDENIHSDYFLESDPRLLRLIHDDRIYGPVHQLLGEGVHLVGLGRQPWLSPRQYLTPLACGPGRRTGARLHPYQDHALYGADAKNGGGPPGDSRLASIAIA